MVIAPALDRGGRPYTVTELTRLLRRAIEGAFPRAVLVEGELSNFTHHASGHMYFALRDGGAILRCVMFRTANRFLRFTPRDGLKVEAQGLIDLYPPQGQIQLQVDALAPAGRGALMAALEERKERLAREGLFAEIRKRPLPRFPRAVGLVTSPSGAALGDLVRLIRQRAPAVRILFTPAKVQGDGAAASLAAAIRLQNRWGEAEVLIVGRGGGAIEDLWTFNDEGVVRAIADSSIPVVSAVGHEADLTLADLVADRRAATPSHAAEMVVPDQRVVWRDLVTLGRGLERRTATRLATARQELSAWRRSYGFRRPALELGESTQKLDELSTALGRELRRRTERSAAAFATLARRLPPALARRESDVSVHLARWTGRLDRAARGALPARAERLAGLAGRLEALGPGQVLRRGYALVRRPNGEVVTGVGKLAAADRLRLDFHDGHVAAEVKEVGREETS